VEIGEGGGWFNRDCLVDFLIGKGLGTLLSGTTYCPTYTV